jgi:AraC-like DNA-binding protein
MPRSTHVAFLGGPGTSYEERLPPPALRLWVAVAWRIRTEAPTELRIVPDGCMDLIGGDVIGSFAGPAIVRLEPGVTYSGLRFHPGGFPALCGVPASELVGTRLPLAELVAETDLLRRSREALAPDPLARASAAAPDVRALARESGYSERQLRRRVLSATGHGPKRMARIGRMQRLLKAGRPDGSWARAAADHGFYDEAHMAADVAELAGATPHALIGPKMSVSS